MNLFSYDRKLRPLNKPVLQVLTVAFGQADEIAVCFAQACILSTGEAYLPPGATLQLKPCTVSAVGAVQHSGIRKNGTAEALAYKLDQRMVHGGFNEDLRLCSQPAGTADQPAGAWWSC